MRLFSAKSKTGEFLSQSVFRAKLCAWKTSIDSSIQAQESGEVMRRKWRGYGNSYSAISQPAHEDNSLFHLRSQRCQVERILKIRLIGFCKQVKSNAKHYQSHYYDQRRLFLSAECILLNRFQLQLLSSYAGYPVNYTHE